MISRETFDYSAAARRLHRSIEEKNRVNLVRWENAQADANRIIKMIARKFDPLRIYQWGSLLHPELFDENSDIDIAVEGVTRPEKFFAMRNEACAMTDIKLDLVAFEDVDSLARESIRIYGKVVYERS